MFILIIIVANIIPDMLKKFFQFNGSISKQKYEIQENIPNINPITIFALLVLLLLFSFICYFLSNLNCYLSFFARIDFFSFPRMNFYHFGFSATLPDLVSDMLSGYGIRFHYIQVPE